MGSTNLSDGINLGYILLKNSNMMKKIFLFSDGCANSGITSHEELSKLVAQYHQESVGTSSFGIGDDFDEKMMKGISDAGHGHYFFIDNSDKIPLILDKAFGGLVRTVAGNVVLKLKGAKGRTVRKLSGNEDLFKGIPLGDMREKDLKQILVQIEVEEDEAFEPVEILEFELSYDRMDECIPSSPQRGSLKMKTTSNMEDLIQMNDEVLVNLKTHDCGELDKTVVKLMESGRIQEALSMKRAVVQILQGLVPKDRIGFSKVLLLRAKNRLFDLEQLQSKNSAKSFESVKKAIDRDAEDEEDEDMGFGLFD